MSATTQLMTADELLKLPRGRFRYELVKGELRTMSPAGSEHGAIVVNVTVLLAQHVRANNLGVIFGAETGFKIAENPDTVLAPNVAFISRERIPESGIPKKYWPGAPDLAVEVLSPGDTAREVEVKVGQWLTAGARLVLTVNPQHKSVTVQRAPKDSHTLSEHDELDGEGVVAGFRCKVSEIFAGI
jgi:Uma2 family endonuclease